MRSQLRAAVVLLILLTLITGVLYPLAVTGVASVAFADKAGGSLLESNGKPVGSELIGQPFSQPRYFWPRPSATSPVPYAADAGAGANLAPTNPALAAAVKNRIDALKAADPQNTQPIPVDLVTASASGLDPHISVAAAEYQVQRIARVRRLSEDQVRRLVEQHTEGRSFGVLGEPRVNVLKLNLALDGRS
jgi:K+-transporting ATPase ATPase C chain